MIETPVAGTRVHFQGGESLTVVNAPWGTRGADIVDDSMGVGSIVGGWVMVATTVGDEFMAVEFTRGWKSKLRVLMVDIGGGMLVMISDDFFFFW